MKRDKLYLFAGVLWIVYTFHSLLSGLGPISSLLGTSLSNPDVAVFFLEFLLQLILPVAGGALLAIAALRLWKGQPQKKLVLLGILLLAADALVYGLLFGNAFANYASIVYGVVLVLYALQLNDTVRGTKWPCTIALAVVGIVVSASSALSEVAMPFIELPDYVIVTTVVSSVLWMLVEVAGYVLLTIGANRKVCDEMVDNVSEEISE